MSGLLDALDGLTVSVDFSATLQPQVDALGNVSAAVDALAAGPQALTDLEASIGGLPAPPALEGLGALAPALDGAIDLVPGDFGTALSGLISPLETLTQTLSVSPAGRIACAFNIIREVMQIATGKRFGGPLGTPDDANFSFRDLPELEQVEAVIADANAALDDFGPALDAARVLDFLRTTGSRFDRVLVRFPQIPVIQDLSEALGTVARWQAISGPELTAELSETLTLAARVIALPRDRVVRPMVAHGDLVAAGPRTLAEVNAALTPTFVELRPQVEAGTARPAPLQLDRLEAAVTRAEALAAALSPATSRLARCEALVCDLVEARLATFRALQPGCSDLPIAATFQAWLDGLPGVEDDLFAGIVQSIDDIDLEALTGPLESIRQAAQDAVDAFNDARTAVRDEVTALLEPVADALDDAIGAAQLADVQAALDALPGQIQDFVDDEIVTNLEGVRSGISDAVAQISALSDDFDPETLSAPIADAIHEVGTLVNNPEVKGAFAEVEAALNAAIDAIANFDLAPAADESISLIAGIDAELAKIDPDDIPDAAKPLIAQGVEVVASIDFTAEVSAPLEASIAQAVEAGPDVVLRAIAEAMEEARVRIEGFRPSAIIADTLDAPFEDALATLEEVSPDALFGRIEAALDDVQARVQILDVGAVVDPLVEVHGRLAGAVEALRPSTLLKPVDDAIAAAIEKVYEVSGLDSAFEGINDILAEVNRYVGLIASVRDLLARLAGMMADPGDATAQIDAVVDAAVARLDDVDLAALSGGFARCAEAVRLTERDAVAGALARSLRAAGETGPGIACSTEAARLRTLATSFPLEAAKGLTPGPGRDRLIAIVTRLRVAAESIAGSGAAWTGLGPQLTAKAASIQVDLLDYYLAGRVKDRSVLDSFANPPATTAALRDEVRTALAHDVGPPVRMVLSIFGALTPYARAVVQGLSDVIGALHAQIDGITGASGVTGTVEDVEAVVNLLREIDLGPVTNPLDAVYARIEGAVDAISPEALRAPLEAARDAVAGLLNLSLLLDPADVEALKTAYDTTVAKLRTLSPSAAIGAPLDAEYETLLATILPVLDLPGRLRAALLEAGLSLGAEVTAELARVEAAFDEMLRAIPIRTGVSVSVSASVSV